MQKVERRRHYDKSGFGIWLANFFGLEISKTRINNPSEKEIEIRKRRLSKENAGLVGNVETNFDRGIIYLKSLAGRKVDLEEFIFNTRSYKKNEIIPIGFRNVEGEEFRTGFIYDARIELEREDLSEIEKLKSLISCSTNCGSFEKENQTKFVHFLQTWFLENGDILNLQDFPVREAEFIFEVLESLGMTYVVNGYGSEKSIAENSDNVHKKVRANVTIINSKRLAKRGFKVEKPKVSITPHRQGAEGNWWNNYGNPDVENYLETHNFCFQTLNTDFEIVASNGSKKIINGNIYATPASSIVDRFLSSMKSAKNILIPENREVISMLSGDFNTYGVDVNRKHYGKFAHPFATAISAIFAGDKKEMNELKARIFRMFKMQDDGKDKTTFYKGPVGMDLDQAFVSGNAQIETEIFEAPWTDHKMLISKINF